MEVTSQRGTGEKLHWGERMEELKNKMEDKLHLHGSHDGGMRKKLKEKLHGLTKSEEKKDKKKKRKNNNKIIIGHQRQEGEEEEEEEEEEEVEEEEAEVEGEEEGGGIAELITEICSAIFE